jgi:hypothetical protein
MKEKDPQKTIIQKLKEAVISIINKVEESE